MGFLDNDRPGAEKQDDEKVESETTEKTEEKEEASSEETQEKPEENSQEVSEEKSEETKIVEVPASFQKRIDELVYKYKTSEEGRLKLEKELKEMRKDPAHPTSEEEKKEQQAKQYLKDLYKEVVAEEKSKEQENSKKLQDEIDLVSTLYPDFNKEKVLETMKKFGIENVEKAYLASKEMNRVVEETKEKTKKEVLSKPKSPSAVKTQDGAGSKFSEEDIRGKSIWELAEQAKKEAGLS